MSEREYEIKRRLSEHLYEAGQYFDGYNIVGIFLQGSQNYGLEVPGSDVDSKLIITPSFEEIAFNRKPVSTTHVRANDEHIDFKDIRLYIQTFRKQNLNFLEILFTDFKFVNLAYEDEWNKLVSNREAIAHYNIPQAIKSMRGIAKEKYFAMEHEYPSKIEVLKKYGYDPKQLHHLLRVQDYLKRYIEGESYESCLRPTNPQYLIDVKLGCYNLEEARIVGKEAIDEVDKMCDEYLKICPTEINKNVDALLDEVQYNIMENSVRTELSI